MHESRGDELRHQGACCRIAVCHQDALERKKVREAMDETERALRESEERYRTLVTFSPDALYVHVDNRIILVNPALCKLLGADDPSQLIGRSVFEIVHPAYYEKIRERWNLIFGGEPAPRIEEKFIRLDGSVVDVEVSAVAVELQGSRGVQVTACDITERKREEEGAAIQKCHFIHTAGSIV